MVEAELQAITVNEFLPLLLGRQNGLAPYRGYDAAVNPQHANEFSTAAYRFGHSMLSETLLRLDMNGNETNHVPLKDAFFNPSLIPVDGGIFQAKAPFITGKVAKISTLAAAIISGLIAAYYS